MLGRLLLRYLKPKWPLIVGVLVFQTAQALAALWLPTLQAKIIDDGVLVGDLDLIWSTGGLMLTISFGQIVCTIVAVFFGSKLAMGLGRDIRDDLFEHVVTFSQREVGHFGAPSLITRNTNDVQQVQMLVQMSATVMVTAPLLSIGGVIFAIRQDAGLSWLMAVSVPILLVIVSLIVVRMVPAFRAMQQRIDRINQIMREQLTGIRVIRAFVREREERERFRVGSADVQESAVRAGNLMAMMFPVVMLVLNVSGAAVIWFGAWQVQSGSAQIGTLFAFLTYLMQILMGVMMATFMFVMIPRAAVCAGRIGDVLDTRPSVEAPATPTPAPQAEGRLVFSGVDFAYPGAEEPVLHGLDFTIEPGTTTAVIGSTGSGKSTLAGLIARLFDVTAGSITLDGVDLRDYDPERLWERIGLIPQQAFLFSGTVASNLRYGDEQADDSQLWQALQIAQADGFVSAMPERLQAPITQGGGNVSGGQRQRLAIARALVHRPAVYVFDDSFSALDLATDGALRRALDEKLPAVTRVVVAQRVSTIQDADQILVLEHGRVVGAGRHDDLLADCQTYREIVESQLTAQEAA